MGRRESNTGSHRDSAKPVSVSEVEEETERERRKERREEAQRKAEMQTGMYLLNSTFHIFFQMRIFYFVLFIIEVTVALHLKEVLLTHRLNGVFLTI